MTREELFITTKVWVQDQKTEETAYDAVKESLKKLDMDYVDLILLHQPMGDYFAAYRGITKAYKEGLTKAIGVANFYPAILANLCENVEVIPAVNQVELHPFFVQEKALETMKEYGVAPQAWGPLAEGKHGIFTDPELVEIGKKYGKSAAQVVLRWNAQRGVSIIPKSVHVERMEQNIDIWDFSLTEEEMAKLGVPVIAVIPGEGCSGGALGLAVADRVLILEHAYYTVISPEGCASILWRDASKTSEAADVLKITARDLLDLKGNGIERFGSFIFLHFISEHAPTHCSPFPVQPQIMQRYYSNRATEIDPADRTVFYRWKDQFKEGKQAHNFSKTEFYFGKRVADYCRKHNISSQWLPPEQAVTFSFTTTSKNRCRHAWRLFYCLFFGSRNTVCFDLQQPIPLIRESQNSRDTLGDVRRRTTTIIFNTRIERKRNLGFISDH